MNKMTQEKTLVYWAKATEFWWKFFDWVAVVTWPKMLMLSFLAFLVFGMLNLPSLFFVAIIATNVMKILAGGKRRAESIANAAIERANVETLERQLLEAKIAALQAQIEPHFLFNTLALIGQLIEVNPSEAMRIHRSLISYLRSAIPQIRSGCSATIKSQIELSRAYLEIMQARLGNRLTVFINLPLDLNELPFPPLMLQSLVENAIKHGIEPKIEGGAIYINVYQSQNFLCVDVKDNGMGFNLYRPVGTGLSNIRERLNILYNGQAELVIEVPSDGGTIMSLRIPFPNDDSVDC